MKREFFISNVKKIEGRLEIELMTRIIVLE
jgi:hypothetical protein